MVLEFQYFQQNQKEIRSMCLNTSPGYLMFFRPLTRAPLPCLLRHWMNKMVHGGNKALVEGTAKDKPWEHLHLRSRQRKK